MVLDLCWPGRRAGKCCAGWANDKFNNLHFRNYLESKQL